MKNIFAILLISILCLSGCTGDRCIDADDFDFIKFVISARYKKEELSQQQQDNQSAPWISTGYNVNGQPLTILVKTWDFKKGDKNNSAELSAWSPWYGQENNSNTLSAFCSRLQECEFIDGRMCTNSKDAKISNPPCLFKNGVGLYLLIADRGTNPNISFDTERTPFGITAHLGEPLIDYTLYDLNKRGELVKAGGINYQYLSDDEKEQYSSCPLYFKILDKFYDDNNGQYRVVIKSGVSDTRPDPLEFLTNLIKTELFGDDKNLGIVRNVYENIIKTPAYRVSVSALLTLYIIFTGFSFLIGNVNLTHTELIIRVMKVSLVSVLLSSTTSWQFFHDYLFVYFVEGVEQILGIIKETANSGPGSSSIISLMISPQTMSKLFSLLFVDSLGFIYIILFLIALYFIFIMVFKATIIYLTALITVGMIITMAPIFICFMLFGITRSLFENWLKQLISYAIQPIILFTGIAFISMIIRTEIYSSLGFAVCKYDFPNLGPINELFGSFTEDLDSSIGDSIFYWWFPSPMKGEDFTKTRADILVPVDHVVEDGSPDGKLCTAYQCTENRYIELPFLDPTKDSRRIANFFNGNFVQLDGLLLIFICVYLLSKFNDIAVASARFLTSASGNLTSLQKVGYSASMPIETQINRPANYISNKVTRKVGEITEVISMIAATKFEQIMTGRLERDALDPTSANSTVINEVKRNYGIDYKDVNVNAYDDYQKAIADSIKTINSEIKPQDLSNLVKEYAYKNYEDLRSQLVTLKFGEDKKYSDLDEEQKKQLDNLMKIEHKDGKTLRELASDAKFTAAFQKAYVDSHSELSERGVGLFGKKISIIRNWQEMNTRIEKKKKLTDEKSQNIGKRLYAGYEGLKRGAVTSIVGEDLRNAFEGNLTGAQWHDFNYNDPRLRTYSESLKDEQRKLEYDALKIKINKETIVNDADILSPEYLARLEMQGRKTDIEYYTKLSNKKLAFEVYDELASSKDGLDPVLMGDRFMREKATDNQTRNMIDNASNIEQQMVYNDRYISRQDRYEIMRDKAQANIQDKIEFLAEHYDRDDITKEELPKLLKRYYTSIPNSDESEATVEINAIKSSLENLDYSEKILNNIQQRKDYIKKEIESYINGINKYRSEAKMSKYK